MDEKKQEGQKRKNKYVKPKVDILKIDSDNKIMSGSPTVEPGNGSVTVEPPTEDDEDTELSGAKKYYGCGLSDE